MPARAQEEESAVPRDLGQEQLQLREALPVPGAQAGRVRPQQHPHGSFLLFALHISVFFSSFQVQEENASICIFIYSLVGDSYISSVILLPRGC
jgi:hypothetical protein